jgi:hypothetical protein
VEEILEEMTSLQEDPRELTQQQISRVRENLEKDLFSFAWFIFGFRDLVPEIHGKLASLIGKWGTPGYERIMIQIPREYFKTSLCTIANSLWQIVAEPNKPIAIFNEKQDNASMWVRTVRDVAQTSVLFQTLWPELMPPGKGRNDTRSTPRWWKWNDDEIMFQRDRAQPEASLTALGMGSAAAGRHWPKIIMDDLISEDAAHSPTVMETAKVWFDQSVYLERPALKGWVLVPCTPWAYNDVYSHALRKYPFKLYRRASLEDKDGNPDINGESTFPSKLTKRELLDHYKRDDFGFSAQMQCTPRPGRDRSFDPGWINWGKVVGEERPRFEIRVEDYDPEVKGDTRVQGVPGRVVLLSMMNKVVMLDPAPTEQSEIRRDKGARNGIVVVGKDEFGRGFILESWAGREDPLVIIDKMFSLCKKREFPVYITKLHPGKKDKDTRITGLIGGYKKGIYFHNQGSTVELVKEMAEYPYGATVDCLDIHAYDDKVSRPIGVEERLASAIMARKVEQARGPCGY